MIVHAYIAHRHTEHFESLLPNCMFVTDNKRTFRHWGLAGKVLRTGMISIVLAVPHIFMRRGGIDLGEVKRFPPREKRLLVSILTIHFILVLALIVSHHALPRP